MVVARQERCCAQCGHACKRSSNSTKQRTTSLQTYGITTMSLPYPGSELSVEQLVHAIVQNVQFSSPNSQPGRYKRSLRRVITSTQLHIFQGITRAGIPQGMVARDHDITLSLTTLLPTGRRHRAESLSGFADNKSCPERIRTREQASTRNPVQGLRTSGS